MNKYKKMKKKRITQNTLKYVPTIMYFVCELSVTVLRQLELQSITILRPIQSFYIGLLLQ